jgi:hypothetical protein
MPPSTPQDRRKPVRKTSKVQVEQTVPRIEDSDSKYAPTAWGTTIGGAEDLIVPSGQTCLVKRPGVQGLMTSGVLRDMDSLSALVSEKHIKRVKGKTDEIDVSSLMKDQSNIDNVLHVVDRVICEVVLKPSVHMTPNDPTSRVPGVIYADMVDITDKMFIFQYAVGGTAGLNSFREQFDDAVGSVGSLEVVATEPS